MSMLLSFFGSTAFGTMLGSLFGWLNRREENKDKANQRLHEREMQKLQFDHEVTLAEKKIQEVETAGQVAVDQVEAEAFKVSQVSTSPVSDLIKSWVRVVITLWILALCSSISFKISALVGGLESMPVAWLTEEYKFIIGELFCLCGTVVGWFFAARGSSSSKRNSK